MFKNIWRIALPSIVSNLSLPLLGMADSAIVGHMGDAACIGAVAVGGVTFSMIYWIFGFLRMGTGGLTAQAHGAGDIDESHRILFRSLALGLAISVGILVFRSPLRHLAFQLLGVSGEVESQAFVYYEILVWGAPAVMALYSFYGWFLGRQNAKFPMWIAIVQNILNVLLSLFLVCVAGFRVDGVAWGTLLSQYVGLSIALVLWYRNYRTGWVSCWRELADARELYRFFRINRDVFLRTLCLVAVSVSFTSLGTTQGEVVLASNALLMHFFVFFSYFMDGFAFAGEAIGGKFYGAGDGLSFRRLTRHLLCCGGIAALLFTFVYATGGPLLLSLFTDVSEVRTVSAAYLPYVVFLPLAGFMAFLFDGIYLGATSTKVMFWTMLASVSVYFLLLYFGMKTYGNHMLWLAFLTYLALRGALQALYYPVLLREMRG